MNPDQRERDRAARGRAGSQRKRDQLAAGITPNGSEKLAAEARSRARIEEWVAWAKDEFPGLNPNWYAALASAGMMVKRSGLPVNRENVLVRVRAAWGAEFCDQEGLPIA